MPPKKNPWLRPGSQTRKTQRIVAFAGKKERSMRSVQAILEKIITLKRAKFTGHEIEKHYSRRSATKIIRDGFIALSEPYKNRGRVGGCVDYNVVLCSTLRTIGTPASFVRRKDHSVTRFILGNKVYEVDPLIEIRNNLLKESESRNGHSVYGIPIKPSIYEVTEKIKKRDQKFKREGKFAQGRDAWEIGIRSIKDYSKFDPKKKS